MPDRFRSCRVAPGLLDRVRAMRHEQAPAEQKVWWCLRNRRLNGYKFRRQYAVGSYVVDFFCPSCNVVVELDGESHVDRAHYDERRTQNLRDRGLTVIRFWNTDVFENLEGVLERILEECERASAPRASTEGPSPLPSPLATGERG